MLCKHNVITPFQPHFDDNSSSLGSYHLMESLPSRQLIFLSFSLRFHPTRCDQSQTEENHGINDLNKPQICFAFPTPRRAANVWVKIFALLLRRKISDHADSAFTRYANKVTENIHLDVCWKHEKVAFCAKHSDLRLFVFIFILWQFFRRFLGMIAT